MADNVETAVFEIVKNIQASLVELRKDMNQRFETFATEARKDRRNINGVMALLQAASGDFDERIREMDERLSLVEDRVG